MPITCVVPYPVAFKYVNFYNGYCTSVVEGENFQGTLLYLEIIVILLNYGKMAFPLAFISSGCTPSLDITSPKKGIFVHLK